MYTKFRGRNGTALIALSAFVLLMSAGMSSAQAVPPTPPARVTLDQAIQEMLQMARQEQQLEQKAKSGQSKPEELRGEQSAVKQGLDNAAQKLEQEGQKTSLLSGRSQRSVGEAQQKVSEAISAASSA